MGNSITMNSAEAETRANEFIKQRHSRVERIFFRRMSPEDTAWVLQGEVEFKRARFFYTVRTFEAQVNMSTGQVTSYAEAPPKKLEKQQEKR
jgi:hypothetical protein